MRILTKMSNWDRKVWWKKVSVKQRTIVIAAILVVILVAAGLIIYSVANARDYEGIFVNGVRQVVL